LRGKWLHFFVYYLTKVFHSFILFKASRGVKLFRFRFFISSSIFDSSFTIFISGSACVKLQIVSCTVPFFVCSLSSFFSINLASFMMLLFNHAILATSIQKDFLIHPGIIFLKNTRFSSFSQTATL
jgi:hypothetical protein